MNQQQKGKAKPLRQRWECPSCGADGIVVMPKNIDAWGGVTRIREAHSKASPRCQSDVRIKR